MLNQKKYKDSLIAFIIILIIATLCFLFLYPGSSKLSKFIEVLIAYTIALAVSIIAGIIAIIRKSSKQSTLRHSFFYNFTGTLNIVIGFTGLILFTFGIDTSIIPVIISCALGIIIYYDIYFLKEAVS